MKFKYIRFYNLNIEHMWVEQNRFSPYFFCFFRRKSPTSLERAIICIGINNSQAMSHNRIYITFLFDKSYHASYRIIMATSKHLDYRVNGSKNDHFYGFCLPCALLIDVKLYAFLCSRWQTNEFSFILCWSFAHFHWRKS